MSTYANVLSRIHNTPLLMNLQKMQAITEGVTLPLLMGKPEEIDRTVTSMARSVPEASSTGSRKIGVIPVFDSLVSKNASAGSGMTTYESLSNQIDSMRTQGYTDIGFFVDSPGGEPSVFGLTEKIRNLEEEGINTFAFADMAASAGFAIFNACKYTYASQVAPVGSIGAIAVHAEVTKKAEQDGITYTVLRSKDSKALGDPYSKLDGKALEYLTGSLAILDAEFNKDVEKSNPKLTEEIIKKLDGTDLIGYKALEAGLVQNIVPNLEGAITHFLTLTQSTGHHMDTPELQTQLEASQAQVVSLTTELETAGATAVSLEIDRITSILETATALKIDLATATKYIDPKYSLEIVKDILTDLATARDAAIELNTAQPHSTAADPDTIENASSALSAAHAKATGKLTKKEGDL